MDLHGFGLQLLAGAWMTLQLTTASAAVAGLLGLAVAMAKVSSMPLLRWLAYGYANAFRALPELLVILAIYLGLEQAIWSLAGLRVSIPPLLAGVIALSLIYGAYLSEVFRAAYLAVPQGQIEAAQAYGMTPWLTLRRVRLPQMMRLAFPSLGNLWLGLLKDSSLVAVIGLQELMRKAQIATAITKDPFTFYGAAAALYILISLASALMLTAAQRRSAAALRSA